MRRTRVWPLFVVAALATVVLYAARLGPLEAVLRARGHGIVDLELAWTVDRFTAVTTAWGAGGVDAARAQIGWDFLWIPSYTLTLWAALTLARGPLRGRMAGWSRRAQVWVPLIAGADILENVALLLALGDPSAAVVGATSFLAVAKFLLLGAALGILAGALLGRVRPDSRRDPDPFVDHAS